LKYRNYSQRNCDAASGSSGARDTKSQKNPPALTIEDSNGIFIARSLVHMGRGIETTLAECVSDSPARVHKVSLDDRNLHITLRWPFCFPEVTGHPDDPTVIGTPKSFCDAFPKYIRKRFKGLELGRLFYESFVDFLMVKLGVYRSSKYSFRRNYDENNEIRKTAPYDLPAAVRRIFDKQTEKLFNRPKGRPKSPVNLIRNARTTRQSRLISKALRSMRDYFRRGRAKNPPTPEDVLKARVNDFELEECTWVRYLPTALRSVGIPTRRGVGDKVSLTNPDTWSEIQVVRLIVASKVAESGDDLSQRELKRLVKSQRPTNPKPVHKSPAGDLTDEQWDILSPILEPPTRRGRGRPWRNARAVLNGVLWVLRTGAPWHDLPDRYPPYQTCHRRFQQWRRDGTLGRVRALLRDRNVRGALKLSMILARAELSSG
jgi:transposase